MPEARVIGLVAGSIRELLFLALTLRFGGPYPPALRLLKPTLAHLEVVAVFVPAFLANAWRNALMARGGPEPDLTIAMNALLAASLFVPLVVQLLVRRRPLRELGIGPIANWRATLILLLWLAVIVVGQLVFRSSAGLPMNVHLERVPRLTLGLFGEEFLFRGFIQTRLEAAHGLPRAWILASLLFGLIHVSNVFTSGAAGLLAPVATFELGLLWGAAFAKTRSLFLIWPVHAVYDLVGGALVFGP